MRAALAESDKQRKAQAEALAAAAAKSAAMEEEAEKLRARIAELEKQLSDALNAGNDKEGKSAVRRQRRDTCRYYTYTHTGQQTHQTRKHTLYTVCKIGIHLRSAPRRSQSS